MRTAAGRRPGRRRRAWRRRRALARWTPRAVARRGCLHLSIWGVRLMTWAARRALRRMLRAAV
ncbi:hypothetical protein [Streptomyces antimicrobicus]|uniref:Uncharacterized protein n=1 Tax=Streptomyces antimicrobicus TaxID=2883108 RepID=A0ABS8B3R5_9ACTN|nr:hypothetical protein [Streptomyces antimicrobicus]MCB5179226.1 hypothetical protein [Streptomyces antimicrobicus]